MEKTTPLFEKYVFVCEYTRADGACCSEAGTVLREKLKAAVKSNGMSGKIRVSRSGCLDVCAEGPNILIYPDNIWYKKVEEKDLTVILNEAMKGVNA